MPVTPEFGVHIPGAAAANVAGGITTTSKAFVPSALAKPMLPPRIDETTMEMADLP